LNLSSGAALDYLSPAQQSNRFVTTDGNVAYRRGDRNAAPAPDLSRVPELSFLPGSHQHKEVRPSVQDVARSLGAIPHERHQASASKGKSNDHLYSK